MVSDELFIRLALTLAKKGLSWTNPNPMVGAVIVKNGHIIGRGFHHQAGKAHAEIEALNSAEADPKGATLYVNLEPCSSFGKTPPCTDAIIKAGIKRVVLSTLDPNPKNHGKGLTKLQETGIITSVGLQKDQAQILNETFFTFQQKNRPFVAIKFAASLDGKMATYCGGSKWITNSKARTYARELRSHYQAILVGINTVLADDPHLGIRIKSKKDPLRIIIDPKLQIPLNSTVLRDNNIIIITTIKAKPEKKRQLVDKGINVLVFASKYIPVAELLAKLKEEEIISILVEGGGETLGSFIDSGLIDKVYDLHAPILIGGKNAVSIGGKGVQTIDKSLKLKAVSFRKFSDNLLTTGYI